MRNNESLVLLYLSLGNFNKFYDDQQPAKLIRQAKVTAYKINLRIYGIKRLLAHTVVDKITAFLNR